MNRCQSDGPDGCLAAIERRSMRIGAGAVAVMLLIGFPPQSDRVVASQAGSRDGERIRSLTAVIELPIPPEDEVAARDALAKRQAEAAVGLLHLGRGDLV